MRWNQPPKKTVAPAQANDMKFVKPSHGDDPEAYSSKALCRSAFDPRRAEHQVLDKESLNTLLNRLQKTVPYTGLQQFWGSNSTSHSAGCVNSEILWHHVIFSHAHASTMVQDNFFTPTLAQCYVHLSHMKLSPDEVARIEAATRDQSECELWFALRNGRITSSKFGENFNRQDSTDPKRLVRDLMGYGGPLKNLPPQMRWGRENEDKAQKYYIEDRQAAGEMMTVAPSGLHLMPEKAYLGASSDGLVTCSNVDLCCLGCLEIKCPYSVDKCATVGMSPKEIAEKFEDKFYMRRGEDRELYLPQGHHYYAQVQGELAVLDREWCNFVVYSNGQVVVDRIFRDLEYWNQLEETLEKIYVRFVIPEILSGEIFLDDYGSFL